MQCPLCGRPTAPNAPSDDLRCGPCHNFRITAIDGYAAILRVDFDHWLAERFREIQSAGTMETYRGWLAALRAAQVNQQKRFMKTTIETLTEEQIRSLRDNAGNAGDTELYELACYALDHWCYKALTTPRADAAAEACLRAINDAEAQRP